MEIGVIGLGHVGLVTAACFAHVGHRVIGVDSDEERTAQLAQLKMPFFEPRLDELVAEGLEAGTLRFDTSVARAVSEADIIFICVGTPSGPSGEADLFQIEHLATEIGRHLTDYKVLVEKSTVPVKTGERIFATVRRVSTTEFDVASSPEFLREGSAVADTLNPSRVVIGASTERAVAAVRGAYEPIVKAASCPVIVTDVNTAELIKHASNAFLATKISFINGIAEICEATGADVATVAAGMGSDPRIGPSFLDAGIGYGGSCFPKDVAAFSSMAKRVNRPFDLLDVVRDINERAPKRLVEMLKNELWHLRGKRIAVLGLAFKPNTDDLRDAPSLDVIEALHADGAQVVAYDPVAMQGAKEILPGVEMASSALQAVDGADAALILTEWDEFRRMDLNAVKDALNFPILVDGRNLFSLDDMRDSGLTYLSMGRPPVRP
jgi:UDPglucose 6-dehydrogenase